MAENEFYKIDKLLPYKTKAQGKTQIKDGDLQIQLPKTAESVRLDSIHFKQILASYMGEIGSVRTEALAASSVAEKDEVQKAMDEAANSFESMMQIRRELENAYRELMQMQS